MSFFSFLNEIICCGSHLKHPHEFHSFLRQFWEKAPGQNWEKMIDLTSEVGEIKDIEHNKGSSSKIHPQKSSYSRLYYAKHTT